MTETSPLRTRSLRFRVTAICLGVLSVVLIAVIVTTATLFTAVSHRDVNTLLTDRIAYARQLARTATGPEAFLTRIDGRSVRAQLILADGTVVGRPLSPGESEERRVVRLRGGRAWTQGAELTLSVDNRLLDRLQSRLLWGMAIAGIVALLLTAALLWFAVRYALAPLDAMTGLARSITGGHRGRRLSPQRRDTELGRTAAAFDDMLDSLEGAEARERAAQQSVRRFVADAAHELRTPITGVAAIAETLLQSDRDTPVEDREQLCLLLVQETRRAGRLVDDMVDMARIDAGLTLSPSPTELRSLVADQVARVSVIHPDIAVTVRGMRRRWWPTPDASARWWPIWSTTPVRRRHPVARSPRRCTPRRGGRTSRSPTPDPASPRPTASGSSNGWSGSTPRAIAGRGVRGWGSRWHAASPARTVGISSSSIRRRVSTARSSASTSRCLPRGDRYLSSGRNASAMTRCPVGLAWMSLYCVHPHVH